MKKIGPYLEIVNKIFGVLFLVVAVWLVERILSINASAFLWAILALFVSWIFYRSNLQGMIIKSTLNILSIILVCYSLLQFYGLSINDDFDPSTSFIEKESIVVFTKLDNTSEVFQSINNAKNITMLDLWADWCVACKELDKYTFSDDRVEKLLKKMNIIKFDITYNNDDHAKFMSNYKIYGPPALMFFNNDGKEIESARIVGFIDADKFIIELKNLGIN